MIFDNLECLHFDDLKTDFPKHFHETFCISLIHKGVEQIDFEKQSFFSESGSISITNPYEIHSNPIIDPKINLTFDTIYLSADLMSYITEGKNIQFINRIINNENANRLFLNLKDEIDAKNVVGIDSSLKKFVNILKENAEVQEDDYVELGLHNFNEIKDYIENNINSKFCLDQLSKMANINKFGFIKKFKTNTGMTPMNYILMKKIFSCKNIIDSNSELTEIAYHYNFTDISHFSKTFKRYIGVSPKMYQEKRFETI